MGTLFLYRVNRIQTTCVWAGGFGSQPPHDQTMPELLSAVLRAYILVPKNLASVLAPLIQPYSEDGAKMIEAYKASYHHGAVPELGLGLALTYDKFTKNWPQFQWEELDLTFDIPGQGLDWTTIKHEWSVEQLMVRRNRGYGKPHGLDQKAWDMLGDLRRELARERALRGIKGDV